jgi:hypothetical protein
VIPVACENCGRPLDPPKGHGRPRQWCSERCRKAAYRRRIATPVAAGSTQTPAPNGDRVSYLTRQRDVLWDLLDQAAPGAAAGLSKELRAVVAELEAIYAARTPDPSPIDLLLERRRARLAGLPLDDGTDP